MRAALPNYLGAQFSDAPPGHRFSLYYAGWNDDFTQPKSGKAEAIKALCSFPAHSQKLLAALITRQAQQASGNDQILTLDHIASSPFATGLGNEHPLENGFSFLTPYGLPYLPGSGVKGVIRRATEELASGEWDGKCGWTEDAIRQLFGPGETDPTRDTDPQQGALRFWDVFPQTPKNAMSVEIMTPHLGDYYQGKATPNTSLAPVPIPFLAVPPASTFKFHVECLPTRITNPELLNTWQTLIDAAFEHAGQWLGFGAKTAVGYGHMKLDNKVQAQRQAQRENEAAKHAAEIAAAAINALPADQRLLAGLESLLPELPRNPRTNITDKLLTSDARWRPLLDWLNEQVPSLVELTAPSREALATQVKSKLTSYFKVEGVAEKTMKTILAALRAPT